MYISAVKGATSEIDRLGLMRNTVLGRNSPVMRMMAVEISVCAISTSHWLESMLTAR